MSFDIALVEEQGVYFAVVVVQPYVLDSSSKRDEVQRTIQGQFPSYSVVLMAQDIRGVPTYYGRNDIVRFLGGIYPTQLPWRSCTLR